LLATASDATITRHRFVRWRTDMPNKDGKKTCFVVMGFGEKTDYQSNPQRVLNLDRTFEDIIEPAVTAAGLTCIRADKIIHSGLIDQPMYEHLLDADLVIADLSTSNANAIYELGVRHALRPHTTIVMAEDKFAFPFDLNHVTIAKYEHLGKEIGYRTVMDMRRTLQEKIAVALEDATLDSPVFFFLPRLSGTEGAAAPAPAAASPSASDERSLADLLASFKEAKAEVQQPADWRIVVERLQPLRKLQPNDPYVLQQLALATYKSQHPDPLTALHRAKEVLAPLKPDTSADAETIGLWGAIHKRVWDVTQDRAVLDKAIRSYAKGYFIRDDYYNGINFAFLLNVRASTETGDDAIADRVLARRIRTEVLALCDIPPTASRDDAFWISATKVEALMGLGQTAEAEALKARIVNEEPKPAPWMVQAMESQLAKLAALNP
jgi:hypothetical protein